jgi:hypothetical protein
MEENLARVPNYTCVETIERLHRRRPRDEFKMADRLRFEVAVVGGKEMYSWPGARRFEDLTPSRMIPRGTTTTGDYATHANTVFVSDMPDFGRGVEETFDGRPAVRFDFRVGRRATNYKVQSGDRKALVPYRGAFWADPATLDLLRLVVEVEEIPAELGLKQASTVIDYGKVRVGASDFLLPQRVDFLLRRLDGSEDRNRTEFSGCRQYVGDVEISFDEPGEVRPAETGGPASVVLPAGLLVETRLDQTIDSRISAIGDLLTARLTSAVKKDGRVVAPKGAVLRGRLRRLEPGMARGPYLAVELEFTELEWDQTTARWKARLHTAGPLVGAARNALAVPPDQPPGRATLLLAGGRVRLPQGFRMLWVTSD